METNITTPFITGFVEDIIEHNSTHMTFEECRLQCVNAVYTQINNPVVMYFGAVIVMFGLLFILYERVEPRTYNIILGLSLFISVVFFLVIRF